MVKCPFNCCSIRSKVTNESRHAESVVSVCRTDSGVESDDDTRSEDEDTREDTEGIWDDSSSLERFSAST